MCLLFVCPSCLLCIFQGQKGVTRNSLKTANGHQSSTASPLQHTKKVSHMCFVSCPKSDWVTQEKMRSHDADVAHTQSSTSTSAQSPA
mmetsp:Transcript_101845/g.175811  ORF Transcript_101845/g.175811 Transcript_101845/m.175811 type:complete len:88 (-) Transcript_101845:236-499(-)